MPSWEQFMNQHVLDPNDSPNWSNWDKLEWNNLLRSRLANYGTKSINSVIIARPDEILRTFENPTIGYGNREDFYWSNGTFVIFYCRRTGNGSYDVRRLNAMFFVARIYYDPNIPVHFHGQATTQIPFGQLPNSFNEYPLLQ